ncbi:hypothetical protein B0H14DRAFT_657608 [Mycena olivaceomarginata]|nr:hypothetical protein B0H14DRAFT_657608 [Mycena olivaceomarginata]
MHFGRMLSQPELCVFHLFIAVFSWVSYTLLDRSPQRVDSISSHGLSRLRNDSRPDDACCACTDAFEWVSSSRGGVGGFLSPEAHVKLEDLCYVIPLGQAGDRRDGDAWGSWRRVAGVVLVHETTESHPLVVAPLAPPPPPPPFAGGNGRAAFCGTFCVVAGALTLTIGAGLEAGAMQTFLTRRVSYSIVLSIAHWHQLTSCSSTAASTFVCEIPSIAAISRSQLAGASPAAVPSAVGNARWNYHTPSPEVPAFTVDTASRTRTANSISGVTFSPCTITWSLARSSIAIRIPNSSARSWARGFAMERIVLNLASNAATNAVQVALCVASSAAYYYSAGNFPRKWSGIAANISGSVPLGPPRYTRRIALMKSSAVMVPSSRLPQKSRVAPCGSRHLVVVVSS